MEKTYLLNGVKIQVSTTQTITTVSSGHDFANNTEERNIYDPPVTKVWKDRSSIGGDFQTIVGQMFELKISRQLCSK